MSRRFTPPSTIAGIKRLGIEIKREHEISHSLALNLAAKEAGFQNFRHALSVLSAPVVTATSHTAYLTAMPLYKTRPACGLKKPFTFNDIAEGLVNCVAKAFTSAFSVDA
ncbi:hypothetical protein KAF44_25520 (plasmid) [Cupriavidus necator]|nr:hypothetical protein KAF44_25520 [Cupriavidus necator]